GRARRSQQRPLGRSPGEGTPRRQEGGGVLDRDAGEAPAGQALVRDPERRHARRDRGPVRDDGRFATPPEPRRGADGTHAWFAGPHPVALPFAAVRLRLALLAAVLLLLAPAAYAGATQVSARAYLVQNGVTGEVLAEQNDRARLPIASITKLMTVLITLQHAKLDDVVT